MDGEIAVTEEVFEGLEYVRSSGLVNMFSYSEVIHIADTAGFDETVKWMKKNQDDYIAGIFSGFCID